MRVVKATPWHITEANAWQLARGRKPAHVSMHSLFSDTGFVVEGVAAAWLYTTNSRMAFLENLVANPDVDVETRSKGIDLVVAAVIAEAKRQGFITLSSTTTIAAVSKRACATFGFLAASVTGLVLDLRDRSTS